MTHTNFSEGNALLHPTRWSNLNAVDFSNMCSEYRLLMIHISFFYYHFVNMVTGNTFGIEKWNICNWQAFLLFLNRLQIFPINLGISQNTHSSWNLCWCYVCELNQDPFWTPIWSCWNRKKAIVSHGWKKK